MAYLGSKPQSGFISNAKERYTGITTAYVDLNHSIASLADVIVWVNYVKQDATNLTLTSSTRITLGATLQNSDIVEIAYLGKAVATQTPDTGTVTNDMLAGSIANSKLATPPPTLTGSTDNTVVTVTGANAMQGEANLTFDGTDLDVGASCKISSNGAIANFSNHNGSASETALATSDGNEKVRCFNSGVVTFESQGTEGMRLNGNDLTVSRANNFTNNGTGGGSGVRLSDVGGTRGEIGVEKTGTAAAGMIYFYNGNGTVGGIVTDGSNTSYATTSDYRLKENAVAISDGITRLKTLKPYRFNFKADKDKTVDGFFAHEVTAVPEAITGEKDAMAVETRYTANDVETQGDSPSKNVGDAKTYSTTKIETQGIDQSKLVPLLTSALQEAITKIETLEARVQTLENA